MDKSTFGRFLKFWRNVHQLSQEELAFRVDSSPRHISRLENGTSRPSEAIINDISQALSMGERDSNHLLIAAGYAPNIQKISFHSPELKWLRKAMLLNLKALDPFPAALLDNSMNILMVNKAWVSIYSQLLSPERLDAIKNLYDFLFSEDGNTLQGWEDTLSVILLSLQQNALFTNNAEDQALLEKFSNHSGVPENWRSRAAKIEPMASFRVFLDLQQTKTAFYSVNSNVGALGPTAYASEPQLTINTLLPEDEIDLSKFFNEDCRHPLLLY